MPQNIIINISKEKNEEIWLSSVTKANRKMKQKKLTTHNASKNFDYTTIAVWLWTVSWSNDSHPTGVVKPVYGILTSHYLQKLCNQKDIHLKIGK